MGHVTTVTARLCKAILGHHPLTCKPSFPHTLRPTLHRWTAAGPHRSIAGVCAAQQPRQAVLALKQGGLQQALCTAGTAFLIQVHRMYLDLEVGEGAPSQSEVRLMEHVSGRPPEPQGGPVYAGRQAR